MCLPNFVKLSKIKKDEALTGYRNWRLNIINPSMMKSLSQDYNWNKVIEGPHTILDEDSGIYAYNYNNYNNYNYYNNYYKYNYYNYNYNYNDYNNYNYYNYNNYYDIGGIVKQWGKVAIHEIGYRSEFAKIDTLFTIREIDAKGNKKFLDWITKFNSIIISLSEKYEAKTISWQDFVKNE